jgi:hypothetical protein
MVLPFHEPLIVSIMSLAALKELRVCRTLHFLRASSLVLILFTVSRYVLTEAAHCLGNAHKALRPPMTLIKIITIARISST